MEANGDNMGAMMTKKQRQRIEHKPQPVEELQPRRYAPPQCSVCTELRPQGTDYTSVYAVKRDNEYTIRYCKCAFCGNTFKDTERHKLT